MTVQLLIVLMIPPTTSEGSLALVYARMSVIRLSHHSKRIIRDPEIVQVAIKVATMQDLLLLWHVLL